MAEQEERRVEAEDAEVQEEHTVEQELHCPISWWRIIQSFITRDGKSLCS
jgi:hypothetical protein